MRRIDLEERPTSRDELPAWYAAALSAQATSGLSMAQFAGLIGVSVPTFYQWRRRLESSSADDDGQARLVEVTVSRAPATAESSMIVQVCEGRRAIAVSHDFDAEGLRRLIATLESC